MSIWKRRAYIEDGQLVTLKKLIKVGNSHALTIPKEWLLVYGVKENDEYWVNTKFDGVQFIIKGVPHD